MAEEEVKEGSKSSFGIVIGVIVLILIVGAAIEGRTIFGDPIREDAVKLNIQDDFSVISPSTWIKQGNLDIGVNIINIKDTPVRNIPGGRTLGVQEKLEIGRIMEGPVSDFGTTWWRINYREAPDGWVDSITISSKIGTVKTLNIFPIFFNGFKPYGYGLSVFLILVLISIKGLLNRENKIAAKKREVVDQQAVREKERLNGTEAISKLEGVQSLPVVDTGKVDQELKTDFSIPARNTKWQHVEKLMSSQNQNDWRQAIIEADIMLDEMLRKMSYDGTSIGDMLKQIERSDFATLDKAWEAHKFRNEIAHTGSDFAFSKDEANRVFRLYRDVFNEFYYI